MKCRVVGIPSGNYRCNPGLVFGRRPQPPDNAAKAGYDYIQALLKGLL